MKKCCEEYINYPSSYKEGGVYNFCPECGSSLKQEYVTSLSGKPEKWKVVQEPNSPPTKIEPLDFEFDYVIEGMNLHKPRALDIRFILAISRLTEKVNKLIERVNKLGGVK